MAVIREWVYATTGWWSVLQLDEDLAIGSPEAKNVRRVSLHRLTAEGIIEKHPTQEGRYRYIRQKLHRLDPHADPEAIIKLNWPRDIETDENFGLDVVRIYPKSIIICAGVSNNCKGHPLGTKILTPCGWRVIEDLKVGEKVYSPKGNEINITQIAHRGIQPCYKFVFNDGSEIESDAEHLWSVYTRNSRLPFTGHGNINKHYHCPYLLSTQDIINKVGIGKLKEYQRMTLPRINPIQFRSLLTPIEPYLLGLLLGDGNLRRDSSIRLSSIEPEIIETVSRIGIEMRRESKGDYRLLRLTKKIDGLGLRGTKSDTKFIPTSYLYNTESVRIALLQGLLDTDGSVSKNGVHYYTTSKALATNVKALVESLGGLAFIGKRLKPKFLYKGRIRQGKDCYLLTLRTPFCPFRLERKARQFRLSIKGFAKRLHEIYPSGNKETICIQVDNPDGLYVAQDFIVAHNTGFLLNMLAENVDLHHCLYMTNELSDEEFVDRMKHFDWAELKNGNGEWKFDAVEHFSNYQDIMQPDAINFIDYLDPGENPYFIGIIIDQIRQRLNKGIAIIAVQKGISTWIDKQGKKQYSYREYGTGGQYSEHRARLVLHFDPTGDPMQPYLLTVKKSKTYSVVGRKFKFNLINGAKFTSVEEVKSTTVS